MTTNKMPDEIYLQGYITSNTNTHGDIVGNIFKEKAMVEDYDGDLNDPVRYVRADLAAPSPVGDDDADLIKALEQRDACESMADNLAEAIADYFDEEIGEHSNANCPWENALEIIENADKPISDTQAPAPKTSATSENTARCKAEEDVRLDDLVSLLGRFVHKTRDMAEMTDLRNKTLDYLSRKGLTPSPLRAETPTPPNAALEDVPDPQTLQEIANILMENHSDIKVDSVDEDIPLMVFKAALRNTETKE